MPRWLRLVRTVRTGHPNRRTTSWSENFPSMAICRGSHSQRFGLGLATPRALGSVQKLLPRYDAVVLAVRETRMRSIFKQYATKEQRSGRAKEQVRSRN